ncbi:TonB-dependent receptor [Alloacidobacterium sp.]|uniref:TonB-dependent receptor n=1 Tax=Alloacidobacterium sp. TaxID=2951999 RepID=UPI002D5369C6|nr:carboxypeptidase regulatory-like domain-containing protein [Alloacidobacterium sp.]HYK35762.1 carboxypeptidase regulatory-like domain-containing protein [Alloacidobacterium sp.]
MKRFLQAMFVATLMISGVRVARAQSTATVSGTVTDPSGALVPNAQITLRGNATGITRIVSSDKDGNYTIPSIDPGDYSIEASAAGFSRYVIKSIVLEVDQKSTINIQLAIAAAGEVVQVQSTAPVIDSQTATVGQVIDKVTVQQIPLNGRHFLDLTQLVPGSVVPPVTGNLTSASRGLGSNSYITAGSREDSANFMINGINLNDMSQNQITFQPSINTTAEFKISNSTYSAEYGRSSGSIVNVATRSGTNGFHGEAFDYIRNNYFDARNYFNRKPNPMNTLRRNNFGGAFSGPIWKDRTFFFLSYEGLRQSQDILLRSNVLTPAQRTAFSNSPAGPAYAGLLTFIPPGNNSNGSVFAGSSPGPVKVDQFSGDLSHKISDADSLHLYYAWQQDARTEPNLQGNTIPGFGDHRTAHRQIGTINEVHVFSSNTVNEARFGFNRIAISFSPNTPVDAASYGIQNGVVNPIGLPQITVSDIGLNFGGPSGFPQGRFDTTLAFSDTLTKIVGNHTFKTGGDFRRFIGSSFAQTPGTLTFTTTNNFIAGQANSFTVTPTNVTSRVFISSVDAFVSDNWKLTPRLIAEIGFRFEWNGTPAEGGQRFVNFLADSSTLQHVDQPYNQNYNYEPRVGFIWDAFGNSKTVLRAGFGLLADQPTSNAVTGLASNPPNANPVSLTAAGAGLPVGTLYSSASATGLAPAAVNPLYSNGYSESYNLNLQQDIGWGTVMEMGYIGSVGRHLRIQRNLNQFIYPNGKQSRPFPTVSTASGIKPGSALGNIAYQDSDSYSDYNALWFTVRKALSHGIQVNSTYTWSKSMDVNSLGSQGTYGLQNNFDPHGNYGLSDFDVRNHFVFSGTWELPFRGNRLKEGWLLANITQLQGGNPLNVTTTSTYNGVTNTIRPTVIGPFSTSRSAVLASGNVPYIHGSACTTIIAGCSFYAQPAGFGNLARNGLTGPGFADTDLSLQKTTRLLESVSLVLRVDSFDLLNHVNFGNPNLSATGASTSTFGQITATRNIVGDAGSSRQLQFAGKIVF